MIFQKALPALAVLSVLIAGCSSHVGQARLKPAPQVLAENVQPAASLSSAPAFLDMVFYTDPVTGRMDGPFDKATGMRVLTQMGEDGVMRVVLDAVSQTPVLLHEQQEPVSLTSYPAAVQVQQPVRRPM